MAAQTTTNRVGQAFGNPDYKSNHYYCKRGVPGFGLIVTPDELRFQYLYGNQLTSTRGDTFIDQQLQYYIDRTIGMVERDLNITIVATQYRHRPALPDKPREVELPKEDNAELAALCGTEVDVDLKPFKWDDLYDFRKEDFRQFVYLKLNRRPIVSVSKWILFNHADGNTLIDLASPDGVWMKIQHERGVLRAFPRAGGGVNAFPVVVGGAITGVVGGHVGFSAGLYPLSYDNYPNGYGVDFIAGYENARDVPEDLIEIIGMLAAVNLMADFGDGVISGLSNASISLGGISESFGTTLSATSAYFGARIKDYSDRLEKWFKENKRRYKGINFAVL